MELSTQRKNYNSFDIAKFICSILVVMIHVVPFGTQETTNVFSYANFFLKSGLCRIAVPLFFMFSGFFLYKKTPLDKFSCAPSKKYFLNILKLYILWSLVYFPIKFVNMDMSLSGIIKGTILYGIAFICSGSYVQLWYLNALLVSIAIISFLLHKKCSPKKVLIISAIFYIVGLLFNGYYGLVAPLTNLPLIGDAITLYFNIFYSTRNGLFFAFFFMALGMYLSNKDVLIPKKKSLLLFLGSSFLLCIEVFVLNKFDIAQDYSILVFTVPAALFCFLWLKEIDLKNSNIYVYMRKISSLIFYAHTFVLYIVLQITKALSINIDHTPLLFLIVLTITILISIAIIELSNKKPFYWLKNFY